MSFYRLGPPAGKLVTEVSELAGEQEVERLFGLAPEAFVAARDGLARQLKLEGAAEASAMVKALRRPPLSAWAVNQLARDRRTELERLLEEGERLRDAHQAAVSGGGAEELRAAARAEREAVTGLVGAALQLLREAGHPTTDATRDRVAATLHAAAADPEAADLVRSGRLTHDLDPSGFGTAVGPAGPDDPGAGAAAPGRAPPAGRAGKAKARAGPAGGAKAGAAKVEEEDQAAARARRQAAVAARDQARKRARLAADQAVLATRHAERLGRLADQAEREAARARSTASAAIEAAAAARERAAKAAKELGDAEDAIPAGR